jgi:hypothetical protein
MEKAESQKSSDDNRNNKEANVKNPPYIFLILTFLEGNSNDKE